jgi:hypothetical protein
MVSREYLQVPLGTYSYTLQFLDTYQTDTDDKEESVSIERRSYYLDSPEWIRCETLTF